MTMLVVYRDFGPGEVIIQVFILQIKLNWKLIYQGNYYLSSDNLYIVIIQVFLLQTNSDWKLIYRGNNSLSMARLADVSLKWSFFVTKKHFGILSLSLNNKMGFISELNFNYVLGSQMEISSRLKHQNKCNL